MAGNISVGGGGIAGLGISGLTTGGIGSGPVKIGLGQMSVPRLPARRLLEGTTPSVPGGQPAAPITGRVATEMPNPVRKIVQGQGTTGQEAGYPDTVISFLARKGAERNELTAAERAAVTAAIYALGSYLGKIQVNFTRAWTVPGVAGQPYYRSDELFRLPMNVKDTPPGYRPGQLVQPLPGQFPPGTIMFPTGVGGNARDPQGRFLPFNQRPAPQAIFVGYSPSTPPTIMYATERVPLFLTAGQFIQRNSYIPFLGPARSTPELGVGLGISLFTGGPLGGITYTSTQLFHAAQDVWSGRRIILNAYQTVLVDDLASPPATPTTSSRPHDGI